ncbi:MAG: Serine-type D-Ala-D-Ala carboxypeptidase [Actinoallomurus sp.]|jgi:D-alanyl-D-alanine carboxypeptidase (penicillin-binding protein 5/6)|nr:Serine-type D-Ala-D-Ala carboxypeptidase [Actinoallomurus sp.]
MRKVVTMFALWGAMGCLFVSPAHAGTRTDTGDTTVGGTKLSGHGYIWDHGSGAAEPPHIEASSYVIADLETGNVLAAKDPHGHYRPASTLKALTAITLIPRLDPQMKVKPSLTAVNASGSAVGLDTKLSYTVKDLFHGLLMQSGNDAAIALAEAGGSMHQTLAAMNAEAHRIQAGDTVARTPNGLDDDPPLTLKEQHSSAYDLALIMKQGLTLPDFRKYVGARTYMWPALPTKEDRKKGSKTGDYEIGTHDHLLVGDRYSGMIGGKNGWTSHALGSFVGAATRGGHTIVISLMHAQSDFWPDARALLNWGFAERAKATPVGTLVNPIPPPAKPTPKPVAHKPDPKAASGLAWWKIGLPAGAAVAILAGLILGLRRRRRPTGAGPDEPAASLTPDTAGDPDEPSASGAPPGDAKVAGAPPSQETLPNPTRTWTVRLPNRSGPPGSDAAPTGESSSAGNGRAPLEPLDGGPETDGESTVRDEPHGDEAAHS